MIRSIQDDTSLASLERKIATGDIAELFSGLDDAITSFTSDMSAGYVHAAQKTARRIDAAVERAFRFDLADSDAVDFMREVTDDLKAAMIAEQQAVARRVVQHGQARGLTPRQIAREVRASAGLTVEQVDHVERYRQALERGDYTAAMKYELADGRFDPALRNARAQGKVLGPDRIEKMVDRYRENWVAHRGKVVSLTEGQKMTHAGIAEAVDQAIERGVLPENAFTKVWHTRGDHRVRHSHRFMSGQRRRLWEPFLSGNGNLLMYPGDPNAPLSDIVNCRCTLEVVMPSPLSKTFRLDLELVDYELAPLRS